MRLVCATEYWVRKYLELARDREVPFEPWPSRLALLVAEGDELVAGVMVYDSTGPFLFFEHLVTNETATLRVRHRAVALMAEEMMNMCRLMGKVPQIAVRHRSIKAILERSGLQTAGAVVMTCGFNQLERQDAGKDTQNSRSYPAQHPHRRPDSAPTERAPRGDPEEHLGVYASVLGGISA